MPSTHKISNIEWALIGGVALVVDIGLILLEWLLIWVGASLVIIPLIDIFFGMTLGFYFHLRGQSMANPKRLFTLLASLVGEAIPVVGEFPFWTLDIIYFYSVARAEEKVEKALKMAQQTPPPKNTVRRFPTPQRQFAEEQEMG